MTSDVTPAPLRPRSADVSAVHPKASAQLAGKRVLILNWRDVRHPEAGGAEQYVHQISRRWAAAGAEVSWFTGRHPSQALQEQFEGITVTRMGGPLTLYPRAAAAIFRSRGDFDVVIDCQNGIPFFSPLFVHRDLPVVQVIHHVHQDQFQTRFAAPVAAIGRWLEKTGARAAYGMRPVVAVSPSTRSELRTRLKYQAPIYVVPNGTVELPEVIGPRDPDPTITVVSRLVPHKRIDLFLSQVVTVAMRVPGLRVNIVGDGTERARLQQLAADLGLQSVVTFHGYQSDAVRDGLLSRAWITASTSVAEGWGCSVIEAAAWGVPCVALHAPGIRDSVLHEVTGWLVTTQQDFGLAMVAALEEMSDEVRATELSLGCRDWARCFSWDRSAELLAGVVVDQLRAKRRTQRTPQRGRDKRNERRRARTDMGTRAHFVAPTSGDLSTLRSTDEVFQRDGQVFALLHGCDEYDAAALLARLNVFEAELSSLEHQDILAGPHGMHRLVDSGPRGELLETEAS